jgi:hypothetical protein
MCVRLAIRLVRPEVASEMSAATSKHFGEVCCRHESCLFTDLQTSLLKTAGEIPGLWMGYPIGRGGISLGIGMGSRMGPWV